MNQVQYGSGLYFLLPLVAMSLLLLHVGIVFLQRFSSEKVSFPQNKKIWVGILCMPIPLAIASIFDAQSPMVFINEFLVRLYYSYLYAAVIGIPVLFVLGRLRLVCMPALFISIWTLIEGLSYLLAATGTRPEIELNQWHAMIAHNSFYCAAITLAFCLGAGIKFLPKNK